MAESDTHIARVAEAVVGAKEGVAEIAPPKRTKVGRKAAEVTGKVPPVKRWWLPVAIIAVLFIGQALVAALVKDTTIGTVFAAGAVIVAILTAIVAVLSYAQQASVPLTDIVKVLDELIKGIDELKKAHEDAHGAEPKDPKAKAVAGKVAADGPTPEIPAGP